jgi:hypothetical protein
VATIRFLSPSNPQLNLSGVPAQFVDGVCDIDSVETARLGRMRYLGPPAGVQEMGATRNIAPWEDDILSVRDRANHTGTQTSDTISDFAEAVAAMGGGGTGGTTTSASALTSGTLPVARIADGSLPLSKLNTDVATQAELDLVAQRQSTLPLGGSEGQVLGRVGSGTGWIDNSGAGVVLDGAPVASVAFSSQVPSAADLGAAPASLVDVVATKADIDPLTGKVKASQLPATSGGSTSAQNLLIISGVSDAVADGFSSRILFSTGANIIGTGKVFAAPPAMFVQPVSAASFDILRWASGTAIDTTGFTLNVRRSNATLMSASWVALGVSA